jgi:hypothetical protein
MRLYHNNPAFADRLDFVEGKERILIMMGDVILDQRLGELENLTAVELTDTELERVHGAQWGGWGGGTALNQAAIANPGFFGGGTALNQAAIANPGFFGGGTALNQAAIA